MIKKRFCFFAQLKASSIVEVTVALVILSIVFGAFMTTYLNIVSGSRYVQKIKYETLLSRKFHEILQKKQYNDAIDSDEHVRIFTKVHDYHGNPDLKYIELRAIGGDGKILAEHRSLHYDGTTR